ncbi:hypothetical protein RIF29_18637 [Crotalaria pallida]|uniref:Uncharacterized protein n=1 Tax=Crotalaria pallida TaxID=3830 RepID=A0AAN9EZS1_CROPI
MPRFCRNREATTTRQPEATAVANQKHHRCEPEVANQSQRRCEPEASGVANQKPPPSRTSSQPLRQPAATAVGNQQPPSRTSSLVEMDTKVILMRFDVCGLMYGISSMLPGLKFLKLLLSHLMSLTWRLFFSVMMEKEMKKLTPLEFKTYVSLALWNSKVDIAELKEEEGTVQDGYLNLFDTRHHDLRRKRRIKEDTQILTVSGDQTLTKKAYDVAEVDERVNRAIAAAKRAVKAARVAAVKAVQKQMFCFSNKRE